jgi:ABC-type branched-subunit amino acid transport system substrate-binding protein
MKRLQSVMRLALAAAALAPLAAGAQTQGVTKTEVVVGSIQDLSGPIAALGAHFRNGLQMRFDEVNAKGGIHGRKVMLVVEDSGYDPKKAVLAAQKLIQKDKVFAAISTLGSPVVMATMPLFLDRDVLHVFPAAPIPPTYEPIHKYKFANLPAYSVTTPLGVKYLVQKNGYKKVGIVYQDDDYGADVLKGTETTLKALNLPLCAKASYKRGATDFSSQVATVKSAGCDFVVLGAVLREAVGLVGEARKTGWDVPMLTTAAAYGAQLHQLGGKATEGLYGIPLMPQPYPDEKNKPLMDWIAAYKERYKVDPNYYTVVAYVSADLFVQAAQAAGPNLTNASFAKAMQGLTREPDFLGAPRYSFSTTDHLGTRAARIEQIRNGRWEKVTDYFNK